MRGDAGILISSAVRVAISPRYTSVQAGSAVPDSKGFEAFLKRLAGIQQEEMYWGVYIRLLLHTMGLLNA